MVIMRLSFIIILLLILLSSEAYSQQSFTKHISLGLQGGTITNRHNSSAGSINAKTFATICNYQIRPHSVISFKTQFIRYRVEGYMQEYMDDIQHIDAVLMYSYDIHPQKRLQSTIGIGGGVVSSDFIPDASNKYLGTNLYVGTYKNEIQPVIDCKIDIAYCLNELLWLGISLGNKTYTWDFVNKLSVGHLNDSIYFLPYLLGGLNVRIK